METPRPTEAPPRPEFVQVSSVSVTGRVVLEDGSAPPQQVSVQGVCHSSIGEAVYTRDRFRVTVGQRVTRDPTPGVIGGTLAGCEVRAQLEGFLPAVHAMGSIPPSGSLDIGLLVLRPMDKIKGYTYSMNSAQAPKDAKKALERGVELAGKNRLGPARKELERALALYPRFAEAWFELGAVFHREQRIAEAQQAYEKAMSLDSRFLKPHLQLAMIAAAQRQWQDVLAMTERIIGLNPYEFPQAHLYSGVANYNLKDLRAAERAVRRAIELDAPHRLPKAYHLLGVIALDLGDRAGALANLRLYLKYAPQGNDAEQVKAQVADLEAQVLR